LVLDKVTNTKMKLKTAAYLVPSNWDFPAKSDSVALYPYFFNSH
jgi:hypothetical protein